MLGTWVGTPEYIKSSLQNKVVELHHEKDTIIQFKDPQVRNLMLCWCFCQKITYLLRTTRPSLVTDFISAFDEMKKDILHSFFDSKYSQVTCHSAILGRVLLEATVLDGSVWNREDHPSIPVWSRSVSRERVLSFNRCIEETRERGFMACWKG